MNTEPTLRYGGRQVSHRRDHAGSMRNTVAIVRSQQVVGNVDGTQTMIRHILTASILLVGTLTGLSAQAPEYTLLLPVYTDEGTYRGDYDIGRSVVSAGGEVRYGIGYPQMISSLGVREYGPVAVSDGAGGTLVIYTIEHVDSANAGDTDILIQRINAEGENLWDDSLTGPVRFLADSPNLERNAAAIPIDGGVLVVYEIEYTSGDFEGDVDIAARFIRGADHDLSEESVWVASSDRREERPQLVRSAGSTVVVFERGRDSSVVTSGDIIATRIEDNGTKGWYGGIPEVPVASSAYGEKDVAVAADGRGGLYLAYELWYATGDRGGDVDIIAQHLDPNGQRLWVDPARPPVVASSRKAFERNPSIAVDSTGPVIAYEIVESSGHGSSHPVSAIGVQRMDSAGQGVWNGGTRSTVVQAKHRIGVAPRLLSDDQDGTYVIFDGIDSITGDRDVYAQHVTRDGRISWNRENAIPVFYGPMPEVLIGALPDTRGGVVVFAAEVPVYRTEGSAPRDTAVIAHRLDRMGEHTWGIGENNLLVSRTILGEHPPVVTVVGN